jgi:hypothetical protein
VLTVGQLASATDRIEFPEDQPVFPVYARFETVDETGFTDGEWVCIPFYRDPACVPDDFNLLDFFDRPGAWECDDLIPPYIEGFAIRSLPLPFPPEHFFARGLPGMPVWFVNWGELLEVYDYNDGVVTIFDLKNMESLRKGVAASYMEEIQTAANPATSHFIVTFGELLDGRRFQASYSHGAGGHVHKVQVHVSFGE